MIKWPTSNGSSIEVDKNPSTTQAHEKSHSPTSPRFNGDYFSLTKAINSNVPASSPTWPRLPSASATAPPMVSSTSSYRGSWSNLFNTGTVRQFMTGVQDTFKDGLITPNESQLGGAMSPEATSPAPRSKVANRSPSSPRKSGFGKSSSIPHVSPISKSWSEGGPPTFLGAGVSFSSAGHTRRPTFSHVTSPKHSLRGKRIIILDEPASNDRYIYFFNHPYNL
jgi:WD repeat-containing protein 59